jgi:hypothetical protein
VLCGAYCKLAGAHVERDCLQVEFLVDIDSLKDVIGPVENYKRIAGYVSLSGAYISFCEFVVGVKRSIVQ